MKKVVFAALAIVASAAFADEGDSGIPYRGPVHGPNEYTQAVCPYGHPTAKYEMHGGRMVYVGVVCTNDAEGVSPFINSIPDSKGAAIACPGNSIPQAKYEKVNGQWVMTTICADQGMDGSAD